MSDKDKEEQEAKKNEILNRLEHGANESGSCDYPNIQRVSLTSKEKESADDNDTL